MAKTHNFRIPLTILRLQSEDIEALARIGLDREVERDDVQSLMDNKYSDRKRAANAMTRLVSNSDLSEFNSKMETIRDTGVSSNDRVDISSSFNRACITLRIH